MTMKKIKKTKSTLKVKRKINKTQIYKTLIVLLVFSIVVGGFITIYSHEDNTGMMTTVPPGGTTGNDSFDTSASETANTGLENTQPANTENYTNKTMQSIVAATVATATPTPTEPYLSMKGAYELSTKENIIILLIDRLDTKYINEVLDMYPDFFSDKLDGFTYYEDNISMYCRTFPAVPYLLSGHIFMYDTKARDFFKKAWQESKLLPLLKENNFTTKLYMESYYTYSNVSQLTGVADNISAKDSKDIAAPISDFDFYKSLKKGFTTQSEKNNFAYYHMSGVHNPLSMNEKVEKVAKEKTSIRQQTQGCFEIVFEFIAQMKKIGLYESSTIIIMGDHPKSEDITRVKDYKTTGLFIKRKGSAGTPMKVSKAQVSQENFIATVLQEAGISHKEYGESVFEIPENEDRVRKFYYRYQSTKDKTVEDRKDLLEEFEIIGNGNDFKNWKKKRDINILYPYG